MNVTLDAVSADFVRQSIEMGRFKSADEMIRFALGLLHSPDSFKTLSSEINIGLEQYRKGDIKPLDMDRILAEVEEEFR